uniref:Uncharacterized protein n=1 Tax=Seriola lalandi dorsalis TaxID=1841481 RepID=A0A3B4XCB5_SERLL
IFGQYGFLKDLLTPAVRFSPWPTPLLGPIAPIVSSDDCRGLTGIPAAQTTLASRTWKLLLINRTSCNQSEFVLLISDLLLLNISSWEEKSHHSFEELVHQLDGERNHVHLMIKKACGYRHHQFDRLQCHTAGH